jgi:hypothetical protein
MKLILTIMLFTATTSVAGDMGRFENGRFSVKSSFDMVWPRKVPFTFSGSQHFTSGGMMGYKADARFYIWPCFVLFRISDYFPSGIDRHKFDTLSWKTDDATLDMAHLGIGGGINILDKHYCRVSLQAGSGGTDWWAVVKRTDTTTQRAVEDIRESNRTNGNFIETEIGSVPYKELFVNTALRKIFDNNHTMITESCLGWRFFNSKKKNTFYYLYTTFTYLSGFYFSYYSFGIGIMGNSRSI